MPKILAAFVAALVAGCSFLPPPDGMQVTLPAVGDLGPHPVTVVDHAGIVRAATPSVANGVVNAGLAFQAVPGRDDQVLVTWLGGECDDRTIITIDPDADRYRVHLETPSSALGCSAVGIPRAVLLTLTRPAGSDAFELG